MPERTERLKVTLDELRKELDQAEGLDDDERRLLESAVDDLRRRLGDEREREGDYGPVVEQLEALEGRFQIRHPTLSGLILRLVDTLGQLGI